MRRNVGSLLMVSALAAVTASALAQKQPDTFTFLDITDTHQTANGSAEPLRQLAENAARMTPKPAFIVDTGDITEAGRPEEYAAFQQAYETLKQETAAFERFNDETV